MNDHEVAAVLDDLECKWKEVEAIMVRRRVERLRFEAFSRLSPEEIRALGFDWAEVQRFMTSVRERQPPSRTL